MSKQHWYKWHSWAGFPLAVLCCFVMLSGTLAVMSHELDWLTNPAIRTQPHQAEPFNWSEYYREVQSVSHSDKIYQLSAPLHEGFAAEAILYDAKNQRYRVYVDPNGYQYTGNGAWFNWQTTLRRIHRHLMMPLNLGLTIVSALALPLLFSLISGLILHPQWWRGLWRAPRRANKRVFWGDIHRLTGLWTSGLLLIISVTGVWYFVEKYGLGANYPINGKPESELAMKTHVSVQPQVLDTALDTVARLRPAFQIKSIYLPIKAGQPIRVDGQENQILVRDRANNLIFDPVSGALLSQRHAEDLSAHVRISEAADPLHFGTWGGYWSKTLYFMFGLLMSSLSITGTIIYAHRTFKWRKGQTPPLRNVLYRGAMNTKAGALISLTLITICLVLTTFSLSSR